MHSFDMDAAMQVTGDLLAASGEDRFRIWRAPPRSERDRYDWEGDGAVARRTDRLTGEVEVLHRPPPGGFVSEKDAGIQHAHRIDSREQIDERIPLPTEVTAEDISAEGIDDRARRSLAEFGAGFLPWTQLSTPYDPLAFIWGFEGLMLALMDAPELVEYALARSLERQLRLLRMWRLMGVELIFLQECMSDQISPEHYRRFVLPGLRELTAAIRRAGMLSIYYYCGDPAGRLDMLTAGGADALSLEESKKDFTIDIRDVAARIDGRTALVGNIDATHLMERGSNGQIRAEVARQLEAGRRNAGRFILGYGSPITPGTTVDRVRLVARTLRDLTADPPPSG